jgi:hypothetical protein
MPTWDDEIDRLISGFKDKTKDMVPIHHVNALNKQMDMACFIVERMMKHVLDDELRLEAALLLNAIQEQRGKKRIRPFKSVKEHGEWIDAQLNKRDY